MNDKVTPPVPQTYEEFHDCLEFVRRKLQESLEFNAVIEKLTYDGYAFIYDDFCAKYIELLEHIWLSEEGGDCGDITYYIYDADSGAKADQYYYTVVDENGTETEIHFTDDKILYDYLVDNYQARYKRKYFS